MESSLSNDSEFSTNATSSQRGLSFFAPLFLFPKRGLLLSPPKGVCPLSPRTPGGCSTATGTCGSGAWTGTATMTRAWRRTRRGRRPGSNGCVVAGAGTASHSTAVPRLATPPTACSATITWASASPSFSPNDAAASPSSSRAHSNPPAPEGRTAIWKNDAMNKENQSTNPREWHPDNK